MRGYSCCLLHVPGANCHLSRATAQGNVSAQVAYSQDNSRWHFPSLYHSKSFSSADGATVDVILIDTVDLSGESFSAGYQRVTV
jgi:hypothetical protein